MRYLLAALAVVLLPTAAAAQQLTIKRAVPPVAWSGCPAARGGEAQTDPEKREEAERLADSANQAAILGNNTAALDLLTAAAALDPTSEPIAYRRARALEELGRGTEALAGYCRYLALAPQGPDAAEVRQRVAQLVRTGGFTIPEPAAQAYRTGIAHFDARRMAEAEAAFTAAADAVPTWSDAIFNRGVVRLARGNTAAATNDFRRVLELTPGSPDLGPVLELIGASANPPRPPYNASTALASGLLVPGLGQIMVGRPLRGALLLGVAAAAVTLGVTSERLKVECLSVPEDGQCPPDQVRDRRTERPFLFPALGAAAALGVYGAIDAFLFARRGNAAAAAEIRSGGPEGASGISLHVPRLRAGPEGAALELVRLRF